MSAALRSVLVTDSLLPLQSSIGHNCCIWYVVVVLLVSAALRSVLVTNSLLSLSFIGHNYCIWYVVVVLLVSAALRSVLVTNSLLPLQPFIGHNCCIWYVVVVLLVSAALRSVVTRFLEVNVTHVYNDQIDSVLADPEIRIFGKKKLKRLKRPLL